MAANYLLAYMYLQDMTYDEKSQTDTTADFTAAGDDSRDTEGLEEDPGTVYVGDIPRADQVRFRVTYYTIAMY